MPVGHADLPGLVPLADGAAGELVAAAPAPQLHPVPGTLDLVSLHALAQLEPESKQTCINISLTKMYEVCDTVGLKLGWDDFVSVFPVSDRFLLGQDWKNSLAWRNALIKFNPTKSQTCCVALCKLKQTWLKLTVSCPQSGCPPGGSRTRPPESTFLQLTKVVTGYRGTIIC